MKLLLLLTTPLLLIGAASAGTNQLTDFEEFLDALQAGEEVYAVVHYKDCKLIVDGEEQDESPDAVGGMVLSPWEYFSPMLFGNEHGFVSASETVLISHPAYGYVLNYVKLRIYDNDEVEITARYLDPNSYEEEMDETFKSSIHDGKNNAGVHLFYDR